MHSLARHLKSISLIAALLPCGLAAAADGPKRPASFTLANGLQVVVIEDHRTPVVTHMIWYRVGSADETQGKSGLAHFLEHLMFKGTEKHPIGEFSKRVIAIGGQENAATSHDYTNFFQRVPKDQLATMMEFEADRMTGLRLKDEDVLPERDVVLEEYNMRVGNSPDARLSEQAMAALYLNHPYGRPSIGWRSEIEKLNRQDALAFYKRFYAPNNATVVVAGDVLPDDVRKIAEATYGKQAANPEIPAQRLRPQEPPPAGPRTVTLADPRVEQPSVRRYYLVPSAHTTSGKETATLDVLAQALGGGANSYLYRALVIDRQLAVGAGGWYLSTALDDSQFAISATPKPGIAFADIEQVMDQVIAGIARDGIRADELDRVKTQLVSSTIYAQDNQVEMARWYGSALVAGESIDDVMAWADNVRGVTSDGVRDAARKWLDKKRSVTGYLIKDTAATTASTVEKRS